MIVKGYFVKIELIVILASRRLRAFYCSMSLWCIIEFVQFVHILLDIYSIIILDNSQDAPKTDISVARRIVVRLMTN